MSGLKPTARAASALALIALLVLPSLLAGAASAGALGAFVGGSTVVVTGGAPPNATLRFPNPARAVSAQVDVSTESSMRATTLPAPTFARWAEWSTCPTLEEPASAFAGTSLTGPEVPRLAAQDGTNWTQPSTLGGCGVLVSEFDTTFASDPQGAPFAEATIEVAADATASAGQSNITLALFEEPVVGRPFLRVLPLAPSPTSPGLFFTTLAHPGLIARGPQDFLNLVLFCPDGGYNLTVDTVRVTLRGPIDPFSPVLSVIGTGAPVWQFRAPDGSDAYFGRTLADSGNLAAIAFPSTGTTVDGTTLPLYVAKGAQVRSAYVEVLPEPFADARTNASGAATTTVARFSATSTPSAPEVAGFPVYALPTQGQVTLYGLVAHGVVDQEQLGSDQSFTAGNLTTLERSRAQTFTVGIDGAIEALEIELADATGHPVGPLVLQLHSVNGTGAPTDTVVATAFGNATTARPGGFVNFTFSPALNVTQGQMLAAVLCSPGATAAQTWDWRGLDGLSVDPYTGGASFVSGKANGTGPWSQQAANIDFVFRLRMRAAFNDSLAPFVTPAGASGLPSAALNYSGNATGWTWTVPGAAIDIAPDGQGGGLWQVPIIDGLDYDIEYRWDATFSFDLTPRQVELGVSNRTAFVTIGELDHRTVVDFTAEVQAALEAGDYIEVLQGANTFLFFPLRVHADGPANITLAGFDIAYSATVTVSGFATALNGALAPLPPAAPADILLTLQSAGGSLRLSNLLVEYSEAPFSPTVFQPPLVAPEGAVNYTVVDLYQWFVDDYGPLALTFSAVSVLPSNITAAVFYEAGHANLTMTVPDTEYAGPVQIVARATDQTGLSANRTFNITVTPVADPPIIQALPDAILQGTTGTYDLSGYISDEDTIPANIQVGVTSVFATVLGYTVSFDYRNAPASFTDEVLTVWADDGTTNVSAPLHAFINNAGRPTVSLPGPLTLSVGHNLTLDLKDFATDDNDPPAQLDWAVILSAGVGATPGAAEAVQVGARGLTLRPILPGDVDINLSVRDRDGNLALAVLHLHIVANQQPTFATLNGASFQLAQASEVRIVISDYLQDGDDAFGNFTWVVSWTGDGANASREGGDIVVRPVGTAGGAVTVTIVGTDLAGAKATATFTVTVAPAAEAQGGGFLLVPLLFVIGLLGIGAIFLLSYKRGKARPKTLAELEHEDADLDEGEAEGGIAEGEKGPPGLEKTGDDRLLDSLDRLEREAEKPKVELPPVTLFGVANARASTLLLFYRDGRAISWGATSSPTDADREATQELSAALQEFAGKETSSDRTEWTTIERAGWKMIVEARAQLVLGAVLTPGADEAIVRVNMRAAMEKIFDAHAERLKRWDGSRKGLGDVDDLLESLLRRS